MSRWKSAVSGRASDQVVDQVLGELLAGRLRPGDYLGSEADLSRDFSVSRTTIRDAIRSLETLGAVSVQVGANGGIRVAEGDVMRYADVLAIQLQLVGVRHEDLVDTQFVLETRAAERAATEATDDDLERLDDLLRRARESMDDSIAVADLSVEFHAALVAAQSNQTISAVHRALTAVMLVEFREHSSPAVVERVLREHEEIFAAVRSRDPVRTRRLVEAHLDRNAVGTVNL